MSGTEWLVVIGGIAAIGWVNWYFFLAQGSASRSSSEAAPAEPADRPAGER